MHCRHRASMPRHSLVFLFLAVAVPVLPKTTGNSEVIEPGHAGKRAESKVEMVQAVIRATANFRAAIQASPNEPSNYVNLMQALFLDDQRAELAAWMLRYEARFPERAKVNSFQFNFAMTLYGLHRHSEALERFIRCLGEPEPTERETMMLAGSQWLERTFQHIGLLLEKADEHLHACRAYMTTMRLLSKQHPKYGMYLVTSLLSAGRSHEAAALHRALLGMRGGHTPRLSSSISEFRVPPSGDSAFFNPWLGVLHHAMHVFPANVLSVPRSTGSGQLLWEASSPLRTAMRQRIHHVQHQPSPCNERNVLVYSLRDATAGFGAEAHGLILALNLAVYLNRTLVLPRKDGWWYTEERLCPEMGWGCYFEGVSGCYAEDAPPWHRMDFSYLHALQVRAFVPVDIMVEQQQPQPQQQHASDALLAWRAELAAYLLRPHGVWSAVGVVRREGEGGGGKEEAGGQLQERLEALKRAVKWEGGYGTAGVLALHIRRGDRMITRRLVTVAEYLDAAARMVHDCGLRAVLLCTEDYEVFSAVEEAFRVEDRWQGIALLTDRREARNSVENSRLMAASHQLSMQAYASTAIANLLLMAQCSHFVGGFGSHFGRLAYELAYGLGNIKAPPLVVDIPWTSS